MLAHNLGRWTLKAAGPTFERATVDTLRAKLVSMPARLVHSARRLKLRAPSGWPWQQAYTNIIAACNTLALATPT